MARRLGDVFQKALSSESSRTAPIALDAHTLGEREREREVIDGSPSFVKYGPWWSYQVGATGSGIFAAGAFMIFGGRMSGEIAGLIPLAMSIGAIVLALGWLALFRSDHGGLMPIAGGVAAPIGFEYFRAHVHDRFSWETNIAVLGTCLCVFAGGHLLARGVSKRVRVVSAAAVLSMALTTIGAANHVASAIFDLAGFVAMCSLVGLGVLLAIELVQLGNAARKYHVKSA